MFIKIFNKIIFIFLLFSFASNGNDFVVAKVNNNIISKSDLNNRLKFVLLTSKINIFDEKERKLITEQIVDKLIDEELIRQEGAKYKIIPEEIDIDVAIDTIAFQKNMDVANFKKYLSNHDISFETIEDEVRSDLVWSKIISESIKTKIKINDALLKEYFEQNKFETNIIKYFISEIFIPDENKDAKILAEKLVRELRSGADFNVIVKQFSKSLTADSKGEIGWVSKNDIDKNIFDAISKMARTRYTNPVKLRDGYYIFKVTKKKTFAEMRENDVTIATDKIYEKELQIEAKRYLMDLHKHSFIEIYL